MRREIKKTGALLILMLICIFSIIWPVAPAKAQDESMNQGQTDATTDQNTTPYHDLQHEWRRDAAILHYDKTTSISVPYWCLCYNTSIKKVACVEYHYSVWARPDLNFDRAYKERATEACKVIWDVDDWESYNGYIYELNLTSANIAAKIKMANFGNEYIGKFTTCQDYFTENEGDRCADSAQNMARQLDATPPLPKPLPPVAPRLETTLPGLKFSEVKGPVGSTLYLPWIAEYVAAVYKYGIAIASILAVILIIIQGVKIIISGGGELKMDAYKTIGRVAIGLIIAWSSYAILYIINPNLVTLKTLPVEQILPEAADQEISSGGADSGEGIPDATGGTCITSETGTNLKTLGLKNIDISASWAILTPDAAVAIKQVDEIVGRMAKENGRTFRLIITSAGRSLKTQAQLWHPEYKFHSRKQRCGFTQWTANRQNHSLYH
jgi:hypothetical protein